jgi:hypothetical protein
MSCPIGRADAAGFVKASFKVTDGTCCSHTRDASRPIRHPGYLPGNEETQPARSVRSRCTGARRVNVNVQRAVTRRDNGSLTPAVCISLGIPATRVDYYRASSRRYLVDLWGGKSIPPPREFCNFHRVSPESDESLRAFRDGISRRFYQHWR